MILGKQVSVLLIIVVALTFGLIVISTPRTEVIYKCNVELYPNIVEQLDKVSSISIASKEQQLLFEKNQAGVWEIIDSGNFPAQMNLINDLLLGVAYLKKIEQKTKIPQLYSLLHVDDLESENSNAISIILKNPDNRVFVHLLVGKRERQAIAGSKIEQLYVRKKGERQSWLVEGYLPVSLEFKDWVNQPLLPITAKDISKIIISSNYREAPVILYKENQTDNFYIKHGTNKKQTTTLIQKNNSLVQLLSNLEYHRVATFDEMAHKWQPQLKIEIDTIHNFKLKVELLKIKQQMCARVIANFIDTTQNTNNFSSTNKVNRVNNFSRAWIFQISEDIYNLVNLPPTQLEELLK